MAYPIKKTRRLIGALVLGMWIASLLLPAALIETPGWEYLPGGIVALVGLIFGWVESQFGAFANLLVVLAIIFLLMERKPARWMLIVAELLALTSFTWRNFPDDIHENPITHFSIGFYVWQLTVLLVTAYCLLENSLVARGMIASENVPSSQV